MSRRLAASLLMLALFGAAIGFLVARQPPEIVRHRYAMLGWPAGARPQRLVLLSDTHVDGLVMPPARLAGIVATVNALAPDCVLLGGDYIGETRRFGYSEAVAPFGKLRPRLASLAVAGNHDQGRRGEGGPRMLAALRRVGITTLANSAARCGPLAIAGIDDPYSGKARPAETVVAGQALGGPMLLLTHTPDVFPDPLARAFPLVIAGHMHCGQIALPGWWKIMRASRYGRRYACGRIEERGRTLIVGGGLGTSSLPLRLFTRPQIVVIEVGGT